MVHNIVWWFFSAAQEEPLLINEIRDDVREECEKFGAVRKVLLFDVRKPHPFVSSSRTPHNIDIM